MIASNRKPFYIIKKFGEGIKYHGIGIIKGNLGIGKTIEDFLGHLHISRIEEVQKFRDRIDLTNPFKKSQLEHILTNAAMV